MQLRGILGVHHPVLGGEGGLHALLLGSLCRCSPSLLQRLAVPLRSRVVGRAAAEHPVSGWDLVGVQPILQDFGRAVEHQVFDGDLYRRPRHRLCAQIPVQWCLVVKVVGVLSAIRGGALRLDHPLFPFLALLPLLAQVGQPLPVDESVVDSAFTILVLSLISYIVQI